jgi:hypothetical protein
VVEVEAVRLVRAPVAFSGRHHPFEPCAPAGGDGVEAQARRGRQASGGEVGPQLAASAAGVLEVAAAGAEVEPPGVAGADREPPVGLAVDAALDPDAAVLGGGRHLGLLRRRRPDREVDLPLTTSIEGDDRTSRRRAEIHREQREESGARRIRTADLLGAMGSVSTVQFLKLAICR